MYSISFFALISFIDILALNVFGEVSQWKLLQDNDPAKFIKFPSLREFHGLKNEPVGHLKAFGMQRPPIGQIPEYFESPSPRQLWEKHVKIYRPAVFRGMLNGSPALSLWNDEYLSSEFGDLQVLVEKKFEDRKTEPKRMGIAAFLKQYKHQNWYVVTMLPNKMKKDVKVPKPLKCSSFHNSLMELNLWIGTRGTRSMLHYDADNIMHCLVAGRKDWMFVHPGNKNKADMANNDPGQQSGFSLFDVDELNLYNNPGASDIPWEYVTIYAGDCIYLPPGYMHQVRSYNRSISTTFLFYPHGNFTDSDCANVDLDSYQSLEEIFVYWDHKKGQETVDMGYRNPVQLRSLMLYCWNLLNVTSVDWQEFVMMWSISDGEELLEENRFDLFAKIFRLFDSNKNDLVEYDEVKNAKVEVWKDICRSTESTHGPTRSQMEKDPKLSSNSSAFNPRTNDHYQESLFCKKILTKILNKYGHKGSISYPRFASLLSFEHCTPEEAFVILDIDMNGVFTTAELMKLSKEHLKRVYNMKFMSGNRGRDEGGRDRDEDGRDRDEGGRDRDEGGRDHDESDENDISPRVSAVMNRLRNVLTLAGKSPLSFEQFASHFEDLRDGDGDDIKLNMKLLFKMLDRSKKGYVSADDITEAIKYPAVAVEELSDDAPEGIRRASKHNYLRGISYQSLFRQVLMMNLNIKTLSNFPSSISLSTSFQQKDEL